MREMNEPTKDQINEMLELKELYDDSNNLRRIADSLEKIVSILEMERLS